MTYVEQTDAQIKPDTLQKIAPKVEANIADAQRFCRILDPKADWFHFRVFKGRAPAETREIMPAGDLADLNWAGTRNVKDGQGVAVTVNEAKRGNRAQSGDIIRIRAVWADWDHGEPEHKMPLLPSFKIETSPGRFHAYWLVDGVMTREQFACAMKGLTTNYKADAGAGDLTHILRVPGFYNMKNADAPFLVRFVDDNVTSENVKRYTADEIVTAFGSGLSLGETKPTTSGTGSSLRAEMPLRTIEDVLSIAAEIFPTAVVNEIKANSELLNDLRAIRAVDADSWQSEVMFHRLTTKLAGHQNINRVDHIYVLAAIRNACNEIANATGQSGPNGKPQNWTLNAVSFSIGQLLAGVQEMGGTVTDVDLSDAEQRLVTAGLRMKSLRPGEPWTEHDVRPVVRAGMVAGQKMPRDLFPNVETVPTLASENAIEAAYDDGLSAAEWGCANGPFGDNSKAELLARMNKEHALVIVGDRARYVREAPSAGMQKGFVFLTKDDMARLYDNVRVGKGTGFTEWNVWKERRAFDGVGFFPGSPRYPSKAPPRYFNLWAGFAVTPTAGDWSIIADHLLNVICAGDKVKYEWLLDWLADLFQRPQIKTGTMVVFRSAEKGTGKSTVTGLLQKILGRHALTTADGTKWGDKFNAQLMDKTLLIAEEGVWAGDHAVEGILKSLITEVDFAYEGKGATVTGGKNYTRIVMNTNSDWSIPVGADERRYLVLNVSPDRKCDTVYFRALHHQIEHGGAEAMLHALLARKVDHDNLRTAPETEGLLEQRLAGLKVEEVFLYNSAVDGAIPTLIDSVGNPVNDRDIHKQLGLTVLKQDVFRAAAKLYGHAWKGHQSERRLSKLLKSCGVDIEGQERKAKGSRPRTYVFPPLNEYRQAVSKRVGLPIKID